MPLSWDTGEVLLLALVVEVDREEEEGGDVGRVLLALCLVTVFADCVVLIAVAALPPATPFEAELERGGDGGVGGGGDKG